MGNKELSQRADFFKHENKGVKAMCELMQKLQDEGRAEGRAEGRLEEQTSLAISMLRDQEPIDKIIKYSRLSPERIAELAKQIRQS